MGLQMTLREAVASRGSCGPGSQHSPPPGPARLQREPHLLWAAMAAAPEGEGRGHRPSKQQPRLRSKPVTWLSFRGGIHVGRCCVCVPAPAWAPTPAHTSRQLGIHRAGRAWHQHCLPHVQGKNTMAGVGTLQPRPLPSACFCAAHELRVRAWPHPFIYTPSVAAPALPQCRQAVSAETVGPTQAKICPI